MMKPNAVLTEYARALPDNVLSELKMRFRQDLSGDKSTICEILSEDKEVDRWLAKAVDSDEFFAMLDEVGDAIFKECNRRDTTRR